MGVLSTLLKERIQRKSIHPLRKKEQRGFKALPSLARELSGIEKAAVLMVSLGPVDSAKILQNMPEEEGNRLARTIAGLDQVSSEQVTNTLEEFLQELTSQQLFVKGGLEYTEKMLTEAYGPSTATELIQRLQKSLGKDGFNFDRFLKADPQQLAKLIQDEHPQTIALLLAHLESSQAATLLSCLPPERRMDVTVRISELDQISPEIVRHIATILDQKLSNLGELSREACGGVRAVANIVNRLDPNTCSQLMDQIESADQPLFENIRRFMFVFRDLESLDSQALTLIFSKVDRSTLITALKGADESFRTKFLRTQSQRAAGMFNEELASMGPVKLRDVDAAQQQITAIARELEKEGLISLRMSDEQYVV